MVDWLVGWLSVCSVSPTCVVLLNGRHEVVYRVFTPGLRVPLVAVRGVQEREMAVLEGHDDVLADPTLVRVERT